MFIIHPLSFDSLCQSVSEYVLTSLISVAHDPKPITSCRRGKSLEATDVLFCFKKIGLHMWGQLKINKPHVHRNDTTCNPVQEEAHWRFVDSNGG